MLGCTPKVQNPYKILEAICILEGHPSTKIERNRVHSIELVEFYLIVWVSAFDPLNGQIVMDFTNDVPFFSLFLDFSRI